MKKKTEVRREPLKDYSVFHGGRKTVFHPKLGIQIVGQTAIRYMRFLRPVKVSFLELPVDARISGRWVPSVPTHPAHIIVSIFDEKNKKWATVKDVEFPANKKIKGAGLSQKMTISEMEKFFKRAVAEHKPHVIELGGIKTNHLKIECDREHEVWPNHGECNGGPFSVPFGILKPLRAYGRFESEERKPIYNPLLKRGGISPKARGMKIIEKPHVVYYESKNISVGFSLMRPTLLHFGWDYFGEGKASVNRLAAKRTAIFNAGIDSGITGPLIRTLEYDIPSYLWGGEVSVRGNRIEYRNLVFLNKLKLDIAFTVNPDSIEIEFFQDCREDIMALEYEIWRFLWDMTPGMTGIAARPALKDGRNTFIQAPAVIAGDGIGCLSCHVVENSSGFGLFQTESYREAGCRSFGFSLAALTDDGSCLVIPAGKKQAVIELKLANMEPETSKKKLPEGIRKAWSSIYTTFRPELGGFSNNSISTNCHLSQWAAAEISVFTKKQKHGPNPIELFKYTIEKGLLDGRGYGYHRGLYLDSDPVLVSGAGRIYQAVPDAGWLARIKPGLVNAIQRILGNIDSKTGLVVCRSLSGNSGSFRWSSNGMDVVGFGHIDAYVNAWIYRALRNAVVLLGKCGESNLAAKSAESADSIKANYGPTLINPDTGWVAGWKSRDGQLHDFAFVWVNGVACAFGVLDFNTAKKALKNLEKLRKDIIGYSYFGVPANLLPIDKNDHMLTVMRGALLPTFECYTDGSVGACFAPYYLRALSIHGLKKEASELADGILQGYADGAFHGGKITGKEFSGWEGLDCGYEGTFGPSFTALYAIAVEKKIIDPPVPEWWPPIN